MINDYRWDDVLPNGNLGIHHAIQLRLPATVQKMVADGADINIETENGETGWSFAHPDDIPWLVQLGLNPQSISKTGQCAMRMAVTWDNAFAMIAIADAGGSFDVIDDHGRSLIHHAADAGASQALQLLLDWGLDVNHGRPAPSPDKQVSWMSPVAFAIASNNANDKFECIEALYQAGASLLDGDNAFGNTIAELLNHENDEESDWQDLALELAIRHELQTRKQEEVALLATSLHAVQRLMKAYQLDAVALMSLATTVSNKHQHHFVDAIVSHNARAEI